MSMAQPLAGKSAFVTGGGSGVGAVIALHLAQAGAHVTICGRRLEPLQTVAASQSGIRAVVADITDEAAISAAIAQTAPDIVIANAGASESAPFVKTELAAFERMMAVNLTGTFLCCREGARLMQKSGTKGAILPVEAVWSPKVNGLPGEYRLGYYYSTAKADDVFDDVNGNPQALTGEAFKSHSSKHGWWVVAQQQVTAHGGDVNRGLSLFANFTVHDKATNVVDNYQQVGMVYKGAFDSRPKDDIGFGVARIHVNDDVKKRAQQLNGVSGIDDYNDMGFVPIQQTEYNAELYYGVHVTNWLTVRPNLQYIRHPGGVSEVDNAVVAGLKIQSSF